VDEPKVCIVSSVPALFANIYGVQVKKLCIRLFRTQGLAAGLLTTSQQVGAALSTPLALSADDPPVAATIGYQATLYLALLLSVIAAMLAILALQTQIPVDTHTSTSAVRNNRTEQQVKPLIRTVLKHPLPLTPHICCARAFTRAAPALVCTGGTPSLTGKGILAGTQ